MPAPDGRALLASGSDDDTVRLWDPATGAPVGEPLTGHTGAVTAVAFGAAADGRALLASASDDETVRLWDPVTGTAVGEPLTGHTDVVTAVAFGTSGRRSAAAGLRRPGPDGAAVGPRHRRRGWWPADRSHRLWCRGGVRHQRRRAAAVGLRSRDQTVRLWDPVTGAAVGGPLTGHTDVVTGVAFGTSGDGRLLLASCSRDQTVRLWDPVTRAAVGGPLTGHTDVVTGVAFGTSSTGRLLLASCSRDQTVRLWDPVTRTAVGDPLTGHRGAVTGVAFGTSGDGHLLLASSSWDQTIRLWDPASPMPRIEVGLVTTSMEIAALAHTAAGAIYAATFAGLVAFNIDSVLEPIGADY